MTFLKFAGITLLLISCAGAIQAAPETVEIPDNEYVTVGEDGHLQLRGKRVRYWGVIGAFVPRKSPWRAWEESDPAEVRAKKYAKKKKDVLAATNRVEAFGFNLLRLWTAPDFEPFEKGDGSRNDLLAFWLAELDKRNIKLWNSAMNSARFGPDDVDLVDDPETADAWRKAVTEMVEAERTKIEKKNKERKNPIEFDGLLRVRPNVARMWDPRIEAAGVAYRKAFADWRNPYKDNLRLGDDPQIVVWELSNEERWIKKMVTGQWQKLPRFFQESLLAKWNDYLKEKYGSEENLADAWLALLPGESLKAGTVQLLPLQKDADVVTPNDANPHVAKLLAQTAQSTFSRDDFHHQRGRDVMEFFTKTLVEHKKREMAAVKSYGKSARLSPCTFDAGEGYHMQSLWLHQHGEASSVCTYMTGLHHDPMHKRFPWNSGLEEPPRLCWNVPWIETQRIPNKPFFVYETNISNPAKYRTEYPYRLAALASIQDFDIVCWHVMTSGVVDSDEEKPYSRKMDYTVPWTGHPQGLHYRYDEVLQSAIQGAGEVFKNNYAAPAPDPTTFIFGKKSLYDPATMNYGVAYGDLGHKIMPTTYRYGSRMYVDTTRDTDSVAGPALLRSTYEPIPLKPTENIEYDWQRGFLKIDAPESAVYTGFFADYGGPVQFENGVVLDRVTVNNPEDIAYPVGRDELYVSFALVARDSLPLEKSKDVFLSLVSTSFNKGFELNESKLKSEYLWQRNPGSMKNPGQGPAVVARAGGHIKAPMLNGMTYTWLDWHRNEIGTGTVKRGMIVIPDDEEIYGIVLKRK